MSAAARLRAALVDGFTGEDAVDDPAWRASARAVPRELFVGSFFVQVPGSSPTGADRRHDRSRASASAFTIGGRLGDAAVGAQAVEFEADHAVMGGECE
ncbi:hypothetical protein ACGF13_08455 [Kitasatospora sp. NPDC048286]|uniref:hypothetical protein n=1 Tax=Kitasatospora sp. NPDC048286 TaxID=3364047 RepID=UPI003713A9E6